MLKVERGTTERAALETRIGGYERARSLATRVSASYFSSASTVPLVTRSPAASKDYSAFARFNTPRSIRRELRCKVAEDDEALHVRHRADPETQCRP